MDAPPDTALSAPAVVTLNALSGVVKVRRETLHGRAYLVANATLLVPGVLDGSDGPILYTPEEVARRVHAWNGVPVVKYHPIKDGRAVTARDPAVIAERGLGHVYNAHLGDRGQLRGEAWFDEVVTRKLAPEVHASLLKGEPVELSTGLFHAKKAAPAGATLNGRAYTHTSHDHEPDHLAVPPLPGQPGACGVRDGCGVNVTNHQRESAMNREETIAHLTANCDCWKGGADDLAKLPDARLAALRDAATANSATAAEPKPAAPSPVPHPEPARPPANPTAPTTPPPAPKPAAQLSRDELLAMLPQDLRDTLAHAREVEDREKAAVVERLTANVAADRRAAKAQTLMAKTLPELRDLLDLVPAPQQQPTANGYPGVSVPTYLGAAAPVGNAGGRDDSDNLLPSDRADYAGWRGSPQKQSA